MDVLSTCFILKVFIFCAQVKVGQSSLSIVAMSCWKHELLLGMKSVGKHAVKTKQLGCFLKSSFAVRHASIQHDLRFVSASVVGMQACVDILGTA